MYNVHANDATTLYDAIANEIIAIQFKLLVLCTELVSYKHEIIFIRKNFFFAKKMERNGARYDD